MGYWASSPLFRVATGAAGKKSRNIETALRSAIIVAFLEHHIVVAEIVGAPIQQFYGMSPLCQTNMGGAVPASISQLPLICGAYNTAAFTFSGLWGNFGAIFTGAQAKIGKDYIHESIPLLTVSAVLVCLTIWIWSGYVGHQFKKYANVIANLSDSERIGINLTDIMSDLARSRKKLYIQRWCVLCTMLCALYLLGISALKGVSIDRAMVLNIGIFIPIFSAFYVLYTVIAQLTYDKPLRSLMWSANIQSVVQV